MNKRTDPKLKRLVGIAAFSALAFVVSLVVRVPVQFLTFDAKDAFICIAAFIYGPFSGILISFMAAFLEFLVNISGTGLWGFLMNFVSSAAFSFTAAFIYSRRKRLNFAIIGIYAAVVVLVGVMLLLNIFVTPVYLGVPRDAVITMLPTMLLPFNLAKALVNGALALLLYKPLVVALRRAKLVDGLGTSYSSDNPSAKVNYSPDRFSRMTVVTIVVGAITIGAGVCIFLLIS